MKPCPILFACTAASLACVADAAIVRVTVTGTVEYNQFGNSAANTFASVPVGAPVVLVMDLDSNLYLESPFLPGVTRGFNILPGTMRITINGITAPRRETTAAYFALRNNDPRADGFFISQGTDIDTPIPLDITPPNFGVEFLRTFNINTPPPIPDNTLNSLDLLQAQGTWGYNNLSVFNFGISGNAMGFIYQTLTIERVCPADIANSSGAGTPDGAVTIDDLLFFLGAFEAGSASADLDNDGNPSFGIPDGAVTIDDLLFFLARFESGC